MVDVAYDRIIGEMPYEAPLCVSWIGIPVKSFRFFGVSFFPEATSPSLWVGTATREIRY